MIRNPPPSPNALLPSRDLIDEIVPTTVTYIVPSDPPAWLDYREAMKAEIKAEYGDRPICYCDADHWVKVIKREFSPESLSTLGKQVGIYKQDKEPDTDYQSYTITESGNVVSATVSQTEDMPDVPMDGSEYLSARGKSDQDTSTDHVTTMVQPTGPLQGPEFIKELIRNMYNPLREFVHRLDKYFIPFEWLSEC